jgi:hypothetical protein
MLGGNGQTDCIGHGDEVTQMPELHHDFPTSRKASLAGMRASLQSLIQAG